MNKGVMTCIPEHDGHPGIEIIWAADCRQAFNQGVKLAQSYKRLAVGNHDRRARPPILRHGKTGF